MFVIGLLVGLAVGAACTFVAVGYVTVKNERDNYRRWCEHCHDCCPYGKGDGR